MVDKMVGTMVSMMDDTTVDQLVFHSVDYLVSMMDDTMVGQLVAVKADQWVESKAVEKAEKKVEKMV